MAKLSSAELLVVTPSWLLTDLQREVMSDSLRFRMAVRCMDGAVTVFDMRFLPEPQCHSVVLSSKREVLHALYEHVLREISQLELETE